MGTEIQGKACFLGNDLNESAGGNNVVFIYPDHKTVSQYYDSFLARPKNGYLEYHSSNKEELKKTILKHESIFKQQLEELHRLYKRHMDLMHDIKKRQQQQQKEQHFPSQKSLLFSQIRYDGDDFDPKSHVSAISFVGSGDQMTSSTILNFQQGKHDMNIIIPGKALNLEIPADVEAKMQNESSSSCYGFAKTERFLKRTSCELFDLNQPFQESVFFRPGNSTNLFTSVLVEPSKTNMAGSEQVQKSRIFGVDISKGNYEDQTHKGNNSESTSFSSPTQTEMADIDHNVGAMDQSQKTSTDQPRVENLSITNINLGLRREHIDLNLGVNELEDDFHVPHLKPVEIVDLEKDPQCKLTDPNITIREEDEERLRTAAETIVDISLVVDDQILTTLPCETLDWFAEIACSHHGHVNSTFDEEAENINLPNGMDYLEFVTLNLTEMKSDEWCHYKKPVLGNHEMNGKEEEEGLGRRLRRRRRGGRQKKDFQRDVLPGIVSLSRYEVSEDILAFEELLKTDRRNRQSNVVERRREEMTSLLLLPGWGRRTKRISRLRCLAATTSKS